MIIIKGNQIQGKILMADIKLKNISKRWANFIGVDNFNLEIADSEFLVLLGPSGCGKTTTMRMIAGLEDPTEGEIYIGDECVNNFDPKDRDVAMVFQSYGLYPNMTVYENICFPLKIRKVNKSQHDHMVRKASQMVALDDFLHRKPAELSGGQRQRVALARAIVRKPKVFLMDEPLSNLDAKLRVSTRAQIKNLQHELATTTIYVTHDQVEAMTLADRVVVMNKGVVQQVGTPTEIYNHPKNTFVAGFIGSPAMNLVNGDISNGVFMADNMSIAGFDKASQSNNMQCTLGFRAEDAMVVRDGQKTDNSNIIKSSIYTIELLGDAVMVTVAVGDSLVSVKTDKDYTAEIGDDIVIKVPQNSCHLFDIKTGQNLLNI